MPVFSFTIAGFRDNSLIETDLQTKCWFSEDDEAFTFGRAYSKRHLIGGDLRAFDRVEVETRRKDSDRFVIIEIHTWTLAGLLFNVLPKFAAYNNPLVPVGYECGVCGTFGSKMWRLNTAGSTDLFCVYCAAKREGKKPEEIDESGRTPHEHFSEVRFFEIGGLLPAIPDEEGTGYWFSSSAPEAAWLWWENLPTRPVLTF